MSAVAITATTRGLRQAPLPVVLASGGVARLPIIVAAGASAVLREVAADLARVLQVMSGARFTVQVGDGTKGLVIGTPAQFPAIPAIYGAPLRVYPNGDGREAFVIRTGPTRLVLLGAIELGAVNGVYRFLYELGCRWLTPTPTWEIIPRVPELRWQRDITDRPQLLSRVIAYKTAFDYEADKTPWGTTPTIDRAVWGRRNLHNDGLGITAGHAYAAVIRANAATFAAHPDYNIDPALSAYRQPDLSIPAVRALFVRYALDYFQANPTAQMVSMEPNDGGGWPTSPGFKALGTVSDAVFGLANEVARAVQARYPGKQVGLYAYREHSLPPTFALEANVYVQLTSNSDSGLPYEELSARWQAHHRHVGLYDYYAVYAWFLDQLPGPNAASLQYLTGKIRAAVAGTITSITAEAAGSWALLAPGYYVATQLMWDATRDPEQLRADFLASAFGPAVVPMSRYYARWDPDGKPIISKTLIRALADDLTEARTLACARPDVLARLDELAHYLRFLTLGWRLRELPAAAPYAEREAAFVALFRHLWRTRYTYMLNWPLAAQNLWQDRAEGAGLVTVPANGPKVVLNPALLVANQTSSNPWRDDTPITSGEITAGLADTRAYFAGAPLLAAAYSLDLVPVTFPRSRLTGALPATAPAIVQVQSTRIRVMLYAWAAGSLRLDVTPGTNQGRVQPRPWVLTNAAGQVVATGETRPAETGVVQPLTLPVPAAGAYEFAIQDNSGYLKVAVPAGAATVRQAAGEKLNQKPPYQSRFFYVPRGTKQLQYLYEYLDAPHQLIGPDGSVVYAGVGNPRDYTTVAVPAGMDGQLWRFEAGGVVTLQFTNIPPFTAASPDRLLLPREVALADGLPIRARPGDAS